MSQPTRAAQTRAATARPIIGGAIERGRLDLDISSLPKDMEATWIREIVRGEYQYDNVASAQERGYVPVTADQLPQYQNRILPGAPVAAQTDNSIIRRGDAVLMVRPRELAQEERDYYARLNAQNAQSVAKNTSQEAAPKDGKNFADLDPQISVSVDRGPRGRFSE